MRSTSHQVLNGVFALAALTPALALTLKKRFDGEGLQNERMREDLLIFEVMFVQLIRDFYITRKLLDYQKESLTISK